MGRLLGLLTEQKLRLALCITIFLLLLLATPWAANYLTLSLEGKRVNQAWCQTAIPARPIVVLGGGTNGFSNSDSPYDLLKIASVKRALEAAALFHGSEQFFLLGGGLQEHKEADLMAAILISKGVPQERITLENHSLSTKENASALRKIFDNEGLDNKITLLSSATHIPRASKTFEKLGFKVCHHAVDFMYAESTFPHNMLPYVDALKKTSVAMHEFIGTAFYWLKNDI